MKASELNLDQLYRVPSTNSNNFSLDRMLTIPATALGTLRQELTETIGLERTKGFLLRYGWHCGISDAEKIKEIEWENQKESLRAGPKLHLLHGWLEGFEEKAVEVDFSVGTINHEAVWINSFEAEEYLKRFGTSDKPVCHTLIGYASGYLTTILGKTVIAKEVECKAMGHEQCRAECHTIEEWNGQAEDELKYYQSNSLIDELDITFKKLKVERDNLSKAYEAHHILMEEVFKESNLHSIANALNKISNRPVYILNEEMNPLAIAGVAEKEMPVFSAKFKDIQKIRSFMDFKIKGKTSFLELANQMGILITPIFLRKKFAGYCAFLYVDIKQQEVDQLILEQGSNACSIYLMNEMTRVMTEQRIQGSLLDDILACRISADEIKKKAYYIGFQLEAPYFMISLSQSNKNGAGLDDYGFKNELMSDISLFLKDRKINALMGEKRGRIVILFSECLLLKTHVNKKKFL